MEEHLTHELSAAYALDALGAAETQSLEAHLRHCAACRTDVTDFVETAGMLAYATYAAPPPPQLRERIVDRARQQRRAANGGVRRASGSVTPWVVAAAASAAGIALASWATLLTGDLRSARSSRDAQASVLRLIADPAARRIALAPPRGSLVVALDDTAALVLERSQRLPAGKTYEAWVTVRGGPARPAGLFNGGHTPVVVRLTIAVPAGATVMTTVEPASGSTMPTGPVQVKGQA